MYAIWVSSASDRDMCVSWFSMIILEWIEEEDVDVIKWIAGMSLDETYGT